jgi:hypothetical protein
MESAVLPNETNVNNRIEHIEGIVLKMSTRLEKIYDVVVGNETFDQEGLILRIKKLENESKRLHAIKNKLIGAFLAGGVAWTIVWELFKHWMKTK